MSDNTIDDIKKLGWNRLRVCYNGIILCIKYVV
jgi:hypothetical protein